MSKLLIFCTALAIISVNAIVYDCYSGKPATKSQIQIFKERNNTRYCIINVKPCDASEWRRVDGSCNNLEFPSRGMILTPTRRVLGPDFSPNYEPRKTKDGENLPLARYLRTQILAEGKASNLEITQLVSYYVLFGLNDVNSLHDILNYILNTTNCCLPEGKSNYICTPNKIPIDDPVHRFSGVQCQNLTRPQSFQYFGCVDFGTTPFARIELATPVFDLGGVYGNDIGAIDKLRTFDKGLLKIEVDHGKLFPPKNPSLDPRINKCALNQLPRENRCHWYQTNGGLGPNLFVIQFYRQHNYIAQQLAQMNPFWDDERLFYTAKDINIAIFLQIFYYELLPVLLGRGNLIMDGVISLFNGFRNNYDKNIIPQVSDEYIYVQRWFHTLQETDLKLYDPNGFYLRMLPMVNLTTRTGFLPLGNHLDQIFQGSFRQPSSRVDHAIDTDMAERILGYMQFASDVAMNDLAKGRYFGFQPYIKYREFCGRRSYKTFDSLEDVMTKERIYRLRQVYKNVEDIDLMAGLWAENQKIGSRVPHTVYCLMVEHLKRAVSFDRHWYERWNRPHAFSYVVCIERIVGYMQFASDMAMNDKFFIATSEAKAKGRHFGLQPYIKYREFCDQLRAIRNATVAGVLCTVADGVTKIQRNAFYSISPENPLIDCNSPEVGKVNLSPWQDREYTNQYK